MDLHARVTRLEQKVDEVFSDGRFDTSFPDDPSPSDVQSAISRCPALIEYIGALMADADAMLRDIKREERKLAESLRTVRAEVTVAELSKQAGERRKSKMSEAELELAIWQATAQLRERLQEIQELSDRLQHVRDRLAAKKEGLENLFLAARAHKALLVELAGLHG